MIRFLHACQGEPGFSPLRVLALSSSTTCGLLAAFAVSCSSASKAPSGAESGTSVSGVAASGLGATSGASAGGTTGEAAGAGTSGTGASSGASAGAAASGGSGSSVGGSAGSSGSGSSGSEGGRSGGGPDAGSGSDGSDAGTRLDGAQGEAGASGCAGKTYKLCEDFETGAVGGIPAGWTALRGYAPQRGGIGLANDEAHSGSMSLKSDGIATGLDRVQKSVAGLGATVTKHWGRIFYKVGSPPPKPNAGVIHITLTALEGTTENRVVDTVVATNGTHQWLFNIPDDSCCAGSSYNWSFDAAWHCAEWNIDVTAESFRFFSDDQEVTQVAFTGKAGARMSTYTSIALGTIFYQTPPRAVVVWFDDLAIDDNQIGCQ